MLDILVIKYFYLPNLSFVTVNGNRRIAKCSEFGSLNVVNLQQQHGLNSQLGADSGSPVLINMLKKMDKKLQNIEGQLENQNQKWQNIECQLTNQNQRMNNIEQQMAHMNSWKQSLAKTQNDVTKLSGDVKN